MCLHAWSYINTDTTNWNKQTHVAPCRDHRCSPDHQMKPASRRRSQWPTCCSPVLAVQAALCWAERPGFLQRGPTWTCHERRWPSQPVTSQDGPVQDPALLRRETPRLFYQPWEHYLPWSVGQLQNKKEVTKQKCKLRSAHKWNFWLLYVKDIWTVFNLIGYKYITFAIGKLKLLISTGEEKSCLQGCLCIYDKNEL